MLKNKSIVSTKPTRQKSVIPAILLCPAWNFQLPLFLTIRNCILTEKNVCQWRENNV